MRSEEVLKRAEEGMKESNKILIRELIHDLEEKGISPVIGVDGEVKKLKIACKSELDDFEKELKEQYKKEGVTHSAAFLRRNAKNAVKFSQR